MIHSSPARGCVFPSNSTRLVFKLLFEESFLSSSIHESKIPESNFHNITGIKGDNVTGHGREVRTVQEEDGDFQDPGTYTVSTRGNPGDLGRGLP